MSASWFDLCEMYLILLETVDVNIELYDALPTGTKQQKEHKRLIFADTMKTMNDQHDVQRQLDTMWGLD